MPERKIAWRSVADKVGGKLRVETALRSTSFRIVGKRAGLQFLLTGESHPYAMFGGSTQLRVQAMRSLNAKVSLYRNTGEVPLYQRFVRRDVIVGDLEFDRDWIVNAARQAQAQAFLGPQVRALLALISGAKGNEAYPESRQASYYNFHVRGRVVSANTKDFETDAARMMAALDAAIMLAQSPKRLLDDYRRLASELGGELTKTVNWSMDGRIVMRFAANGRALTISPTTVQIGWRQDRLRTRVACDTGATPGSISLEIDQNTDLTPLVHDARLAQQAMLASQLVHAQLTPMLVWVDLDGHVTDLARLQAAGYLASSLSLGKAGGQGPYR